MLRRLFGPKIGDRRTMKRGTMRKVKSLYCGDRIQEYDVEATCGMHGKADKFIQMEDDTQMDLKKIPCQGVDWVHRQDGEKWRSLVNMAVIRGVRQSAEKATEMTAILSSTGKEFCFIKLVTWKGEKGDRTINGSLL